MNDEHHATIACLVQDSKQNVYAVINRHVTQNAREGKLYIRKDDETDVYIGRRLSQSERCQGAPDIDLIRIDTDTLVRCNTDVFDTKGERRKYKLFDGPVRDIYGKRIFKCGIVNCYQSKFVASEYKAQSGRIAPFEFHEFIKNIIKDEYQFLVEGVEIQFSGKGESGTLLALDSDSDRVELIGIIGGGEFENQRDEKVNIPYHYTLCIFLLKGLDFLSKEYGLELKLHCSTEEQGECKGNILSQIQCGTTIFFKTPEKVAPLSGDLFGQIMDLFCFRETDTELANVEFIRNKEKELSAIVNDRNLIELRIFAIDHDDKFTLYHSYKACTYIYSSQYKKAEKHFRKACWSLRQWTGTFAYRLLCKLTSYATWYFLRTNQLENMKKLFDEGLKSMTHNQDNNSLAKESLVYNYYDYSRYYLKINDREKAENMAKIAMDRFRKLYDEDKSQDSENRFTLTVCHYVSIKLGCGEDLVDTVSALPQDIDIAEASLKVIEPHMNMTPVVQKVDYLLCVCDLEFRKCNILKALESAEKCRSLAEQHELKDATRCVEKRIQHIKQLIG